MKLTLASIALAITLPSYAAETPKTSVPPPPPCGFNSVPDDFSVTFSGKQVVANLINLLNDAPMTIEQRAIDKASVFGPMDEAVKAWCAKAKK